MSKQHTLRRLTLYGKVAEDEMWMPLIDTGAKIYRKQNDIVINGEMETVLYLCSSDSREILYSSINVAVPDTAKIVEFLSK